jgi:hypothetical protein
MTTPRRVVAVLLLMGTGCALLTGVWQQLQAPSHWVC